MTNIRYGGVKRPFGIFLKILPFWWSHLSLTLYHQVPSSTNLLWPGSPTNYQAVSPYMLKCLFWSPIKHKAPPEQHSSDKRFNCNGLMQRNLNCSYIFPFRLSHFTFCSTKKVILNIIVQNFVSNLFTLPNILKFCFDGKPGPESFTM